MESDEPHYVNGGVSLGSPTALRCRCNLIWLRFRSIAARTKNSRHFLVDVLVISVLAALCGADDFEEIALFGQQKESLLRHYLPLPYGPLSADTIRRVFEKLDAARFNACFMAWMQEVLPAEGAGQRCVNGKTLRGSGPKLLHVVSAVA